MAAGSSRDWAVVVVGVLLLASHDFISCETQHAFGAISKNVTFTPLRAISFQDILWKQQKDKVIEWHTKFNPEPLPYQQFKGRVNLDTTSGDLTIYNLTFSDQNEYQFYSPSIKEKIKFSLKVVDEICCNIQLKVGILNENVTFTVPKTAAFKDIVWKKGEDTIIEWNESLEQKVKVYPEFENRVYFNMTTGDLTIFNLTPADEGEYEIESPRSKDNIKFSLKVVEYICCETQLVVGIVNKEVNFTVLSSIPFKHILWKNSKGVAVEWNANENPTYKFSQNFKNRAKLNTTSGDLTIYNLTPGDEDKYEFESPSIKDNLNFSLKVLESLPHPKINCTDTSENFMFLCELPKSDETYRNLLEYSWTCSSPQCENITSSEIRLGKNEDLSQEVSCIIRNPVSTQKSSITLKSCIQASQRHRLYILIPLAVIFSVASLVVCTNCIKKRT